MSLYVAEGMALANYQFLKYFSTQKKTNSLKAIFVNAESSVIHNMNAVVSGTYMLVILLMSPCLI